MTADDQSGDTQHEPVRVDPKVLEILVCPVTKTHLEYDVASQELISRAAGLAFPIQDGVPMMIVSAARTLDASSPRSKP